MGLVAMMSSDGEYPSWDDGGGLSNPEPFGNGRTLVGVTGDDRCACETRARVFGKEV